MDVLAIAYSLKGTILWFSTTVHHPTVYFSWGPEFSSTVMSAPSLWWIKWCWLTSCSVVALMPSPFSVVIFCVQNASGGSVNLTNKSLPGFGKTSICREGTSFTELLVERGRGRITIKSMSLNQLLSEMPFFAMCKRCWPRAVIQMLEMLHRGAPQMSW